MLGVDIFSTQPCKYQRNSYLIHSLNFLSPLGILCIWTGTLTVSVNLFIRVNGVFPLVIFVVPYHCDSLVRIAEFVG